MDSYFSSLVAAVDINAKFGVGFYLVLGLVFTLLNLIFLPLGIYILFKKELRVTSHVKIIGNPAIILGFLYTFSSFAGLVILAGIINSAQQGVVQLINVWGIVISIVVTLILVIFGFIKRSGDTS